MSELTEAQIEANRENGKKGGVKTDEGKAISRYNAIKHGLLSQEILLVEEDEESLIELGKRLRADLKPANELEVVLVDRIVSNIWRLRRAMQVERDMIEDSRKEFMSDRKKGMGEAFRYDFANSEGFLKFTRYETSIERSIYKALHELERMQSARNGDKPPAPIVIETDE